MLAPAVTVVDYRLCNMDSMRRALELCGARVHIATSPREIEAATRLILPGVGAFPDAMQNLREQNLIEPLREQVLGAKKPLLGVCLGMQLLATSSEEMELTPGLDLIAGRVVRLQPQQGERVPHVGWNEVRFCEPLPMGRELEEARDFYFVHSFHFVPNDAAHIAAQTDYCGSFASVVGHDHIWGAQFHPEKSQKAGFQLLKNFLAL